MKKIFLALTILAGISFVSCDPIEDDFAAPKSVTQETFDVTAKTIFMTDENGAEYAVGVIENHSPIPSWIEYNVPDFNDDTRISGVKNGCSVVLRTEGPNRFYVHGINPDGSKVDTLVIANCPVGKRKAELPSLENLVWEPLIDEKTKEPLLPQVKDWDTSETRFADPAGGEGVMGQWDQQQYDSKMKGKNVFIEFDKPWTGQIVMMTGWWSLNDTYYINGDGVNNTYKVYMDPALIEKCYSEHLAFRGNGGLADQNVHIVKMYSLLEL